MVTTEQRSEIFRTCNTIFKQKKFDRSNALKAAWMAFKCQDIFALMLVRRYDHSSPQKRTAANDQRTRLKNLSLFK